MDTDNLYTLENIDEKSLIETLKKKFSDSKVYFNCGMILVSLNPYKTVDIYSKEVIDLYRRRMQSLQPHVYFLAEECIQNQEIYGEHTIVINGDSGSGKTECARHILNYLEIPQLSDVENILESLGNCKTLLNDNSSRFGKLIQLNKSVSIQTFLLEKSRVTGFAKGERNFHVFYYVLAHKEESIDNDFINFNANKGIFDLHSSSFVNIFNKDEEKDLQSLGNKTGEVKSAKNEVSVPLKQIRHSFRSLEALKESYLILKRSFSSIGIDINQIDKILLGILYVGSIELKAGCIDRNINFSKAVQNLSLDEDKFADFLTYRTISIKDEVIKKPLSERESKVLRDSFVRQVYDTLFSFIVDKINKSLICLTVDYKINILDIFGFEDFPCSLSNSNEVETDSSLSDNLRKSHQSSFLPPSRNGLDQFCINWCNEKIHNIFISDTFNNQRDLLLSEGVMSDIPIFEILKKCQINNSSISIIEKKLGIVDLIIEETKFGGSAENLGIKIEKHLNLKVLPGNYLEVNHYNGKVFYSLEDIVMRNNEKSIRIESFLKDPSILLTGNSEDPSFIGQFYRTLCSSINQSNSVVFGFSKSLLSLFEIINKTKIKYIKCIKPNLNKSGTCFDEQIVLEQLRSGGILQSIYLSKHLYPYTMDIDEFKSRYPFINGNEEYITKGRTVVFFNNEGYKILESERKKFIEEKENTIFILFEVYCTIMAKELLGIQQSKPFVTSVEEVDVVNDIIEEASDSEMASEEANVESKIQLHATDLQNHKVIHSVDIEETTSDNPNTRIDKHSDIIENSNPVEEGSYSASLKSFEEKCYSILNRLEKDIKEDIEFVKEKSKAKKLEDENRILKKTLSDLKRELERLLEVKTQKTVKAKQNTMRIVFTTGQSLEQSVKAMVRLFSENVPLPSEYKHSKNDMLSFSHCLFYIITSFECCSLIFNILRQKIDEVKDDLNCLLFFLTNMIELFALFTNHQSKKNTDVTAKAREKNLLFNTDSTQNSSEKYDFNPGFEQLSKVKLTESHNNNHRNNGEKVNLEKQKDIKNCTDEKDITVNVNTHKFITNDKINSTGDSYFDKNKLEENCFLDKTGNFLSDLPANTTSNSLAEVKLLISILVNKISKLSIDSVSDIIPQCVLDYEHLKSKSKYKAIYNRIFNIPSISKLLEKLDYLCTLSDYYFIPKPFIFSNISFVLSSIDHLVFNSLMIRKSFLNFNKIYQIKYNLAEIEKFCFNIGCRDAYLNLAYVNEALKVASFLSSEEINSPVTISKKDTKKSYNKIKSKVEVKDLKEIDKDDLIINKYNCIISGQSISKDTVSKDSIDVSDRSIGCKLLKDSLSEQGSESELLTGSKLGINNDKIQSKSFSIDPKLSNNYESLSSSTVKNMSLSSMIKSKTSDILRFTIKESKDFQSITDMSFLNAKQINAIASLFSYDTIERLEEDQNDSKFITNPTIIVPSIDGIEVSSDFVEPSYIPIRVLSKILKFL